MREDAILTMPAGREMDLIVHKKIFGNENKAYETLPRYSTYISAAWEVVEKLCNETGCDIVKVCKRDPELLRGAWSCNFGRGAEAFADTAPLAVCRAALLITLESQ